jgi:hypothetical protein
MRDADGLEIGDQLRGLRLIGNQKEQSAQHVTSLL